MLAKSSGFLKRASKITPQLFIDLMFYAVSKEYKSLRNISNEAREEFSMQISKQGLDNRFSQASVDFSKQLLEEALNNQFREANPIVNLQVFKRVLIKDSTRFDVDKTLKEHFPSYGGKTSEAGVSIQLEYDLKTSKINDLEVQSSLNRDSVDAISKIDLIKGGDLIIRDLGYFHSDVFEYIIEHEAYFLTRLHATTKVYLTKECANAISFSKIYQQMATNQIPHLDLEVFVGSKKRIPMRLIIALMPEEIYQKRIRNRNNDNKCSGYTTSQEFKDRAHLNLFLCNIHSSEIKADDVCKLYQVRWQVELIFKTWKSLVRISDMKKMKLARLQTILNMKLLWIVMHWEIIQPIKNHLFKINKKILSIFKCIDTLQEHRKTLRQTIKLKKTDLEKLLHKLYSYFSKNHWLEKRKNKNNYENLMVLFI
jgi:hypothetical protein